MSMFLIQLIIRLMNWCSVHHFQYFRLCSLLLFLTLFMRKEKIKINLKTSLVLFLHFCLCCPNVHCPLFFFIKMWTWSTWSIVQKWNFHRFFNINDSKVHITFIFRRSLFTHAQNKQNFILRIKFFIVFTISSFIFP